MIDQGIWRSSHALDRALNDARQEFYQLRGLIFAMKEMDESNTSERREAMGALVVAADQQAKRLFAILDPLADGRLPGQPWTRVKGTGPNT